MIAFLLPLNLPKIKNLEFKIQNPGIQNPNSKLFRPDFGDFGFWILNRYVAILYVRPPRPQIWTLAGNFFLNFGFWILILEHSVANLCVQILDFGFRILDFGFRILDFGTHFGFYIR